MKGIPDEIWGLAELTEEFVETREEYREQLEFYKDWVRDNDNLPEHFDSESEAVKYQKEVMKKLNEKADELQELGSQLHYGRRGFNPNEYTSEEFREVPGINYQGTRQLILKMDESFKDLRKLEESSLLEDVREEFTVDYEKMKQAQNLKNLNPEEIDLDRSISSEDTENNADDYIDNSTVDLTTPDNYEELMDLMEDLSPETDDLYDFENDES